MTSPPGAEPSSPRPVSKGPAAFRTISEASAELGVPQHVLRFWETRFAFIRPTKRAGGRRFYRPQDLDVLRGVRALLQDDGYTIKGVQKLHREQGLKRLLAAAGVGEAAASRLAAEVEGSAPEAEPLSTDVASHEAEEAGPETGDLFGDGSTEDARPPTDAPAGETLLRVGRSVLDAASRARLADVLGDLEATKAEIDALLHDA